MANNFIQTPQNPFISLVGANTMITGSGMYDIQPQLLISFIDAHEFEKDIKISFGSVAEYYTLEKGESVISHHITSMEAHSLLTASTTDHVKVDFEITYLQDNMEVGEKQKFSFQIGISDQYLNELVEYLNPMIQYSPAFSRPLNGDIQINELLDNNINHFTITIGNIPSEIAQITLEFNRERLRFNAPFTTIEKRFGPYKEFNMSVDPLEKLKMRVKDKRGLVIDKEIEIKYRRYFPPIISIDSVERAGGFGTSVVIQGLKIKYFQLREEALELNRMTSFNMNFYSNNDSGFTPNVILPENLLGGGSFPDVLITAKEEFSVRESYRIQFTGSDLLNPAGVDTGKSKLFSIPTGRPIMYMDSARAEVGIGTTDPLGSFHVEGTSYARASFALNSIFYKPGIPEDSENYEPPWAMSPPGVVDDVFDGSIYWGKLETISWIDLLNKKWGDLNK